VRELEDKVVLLSGAGRGIGIGIALALAKAGARIGLFGRTRESLEQTQAKLAKLGAQSTICVGDVGIRADVMRAVSLVEEEQGPIWALVNNAYFAMRSTIEEMTADELEKTLRPCVYGAVYTMQACFPTMRERGGRIINFGSGASAEGMPELGAYNIAKEAIRGLTKSAAVEWGRYGITVNTISPVVFSSSWTEESRRGQIPLIPLGRTGHAECDVGSLVVFLAGPGGGFITSRTIHVDGGRFHYDR